MQRIYSTRNSWTLGNRTNHSKILISSLLVTLLFIPCFLQAASLNSDLLTQIGRDYVITEDWRTLQQVSGPLMDSAGVSGVGASASASLDIDYGLIRSRASGYMNYTGTGTDFVVALANGSIQDLVTITGGTTGTLGTLTAQVYLSGFGSATAAGPPEDPGYETVVAAYGVELSNLYGYGGTSVTGGWNSSTDGFRGDPLGQAYTLTTSFIFGTQWALGFSSSLFVSISPTSAAGTYQGELDLWNTITWLGIQSITDEAGNAIGSYSISSESGFDWSSAHPSAVPIPTAFWLFGSGLIGLIGIARRKTHV